MRELPHSLISAFHSTLESALNCDLALIVCDASDDYEMQLNTTLSTLDELHYNIPYLIVMNKSENLENFDGYPAGSIFISAKTHAGIDGLKGEILRFFQKEYTDVRLFVPYSRMKDYSAVKKYATEKTFSYEEEGVFVSARIRKIYLPHFKDFLSKADERNA